MLDIRSSWAGVVCVAIWIALGSGASAQERVDSSIRAWADIDFYKGDVLFPGTEVTALTPVLRGELELSSFQLGLDLPFAIGVTDFDSELLQGTDAEGGGTGAELGNPTLHVDYLLEQKPLRVTVGLALAISSSGREDDPSAGDRASDAAAAAGSFGRGLWNAWWYTTSSWALIVPASVEYVTDEYEAGAEAAVAWFLPREDRNETGIVQLGYHAAALVGPAVLGGRLTSVIMVDDDFLGSDHFQLSVEPYAELRLPIAWLGLGFNIPLDEPVGVLGDGPGVWALRVSGGASF